MNNKSLLTIVIVLLLGIFAIVAYEEMDQQSPGEELAESIGEVGEEIGDEIDDATTD